MKRIICLLSVGVLILGAVSCSSDTKDSATTKAFIQPATNAISTQTQYQGETVATSQGETLYNYSTDSDSTKQETTTTKATTTDKNGKTVSNTTTKYQGLLTIKYKSLNHLEAQMMRYTSLSKLLKNGGVKNNDKYSTPFIESNLSLIFTEKRFYIPTLPSDCKFQSAYLCSEGYYVVHFSRNKKNEFLKIYTNTNYSNLNLSKLTMKFDTDRGITVFQNANKQLCWLQDSNYYVIYSGRSQDFVNKLYMKIGYVNQK